MVKKILILIICTFFVFPVFADSNMLTMQIEQKGVTLNPLQFINPADWQPYQKSINYVLSWEAPFELTLPVMPYPKPIFYLVTVQSIGKISTANVKVTLDGVVKCNLARGDACSFQVPLNAPKQGSRAIDIVKDGVSVTAPNGAINVDMIKKSDVSNE